MSGWEVGDLALCVKAHSHPNYGSSGLLEGVIYRVRGIGSGKIPNVITGGIVGLHLYGLYSKSPHGFDANRFRKIKPDTEPCEEEFTALIKRGKKVSA